MYQSRVVDEERWTFYNHIFRLLSGRGVALKETFGYRDAYPYKIPIDRLVPLGQPDYSHWHGASRSWICFDPFRDKPSGTSDFDGIDIIDPILHQDCSFPDTLDMLHRRVKSRLWV